ncbi:hypothetical protein Hanom_Chr13g01233841 [Helianthus anomalus]
MFIDISNFVINMHERNSCMNVQCYSDIDVGTSLGTNPRCKLVGLCHKLVIYQIAKYELSGFLLI